jgi:CheY-like chemotaxis protein
MAGYGHMPQSLVVLVEPETTVSEGLEASLRDAGFEVFATRDGEEALRRVEEASVWVPWWPRFPCRGWAGRRSQRF